jgi:membrane protein implicated in regulation of membrane protease activity
MADWLIWLIVAGVLAVVEVTTLTFVLGMLAVAAGGAAAVAAFGAPPAIQVAAFAAGSIVLLGFVRPIAQRHRHMPVGLRTGTAALVGRRAIALTPVDAHSGQVRIGGETWSARSYDESTVIPAGASVDVANIDGATAVVIPLEIS